MMELEELLLSEVSQWERDRCKMISHMWNLRFTAREQQRAKGNTRGKLILTIKFEEGSWVYWRDTRIQQSCKYRHLIKMKKKHTKIQNC